MVVSGEGGGERPMAYFMEIPMGGQAVDPGIGGGADPSCWLF